MFISKVARNDAKNVVSVTLETMQEMLWAWRLKCCNLIGVQVFCSRTKLSIGLQSDFPFTAEVGLHSTSLAGGPILTWHRCPCMHPIRIVKYPFHHEQRVYWKSMHPLWLWLNYPLRKWVCFWNEVVHLYARNSLCTVYKAIDTKFNWNRQVHVSMKKHIT